MRERQTTPPNTVKPIGDLALLFDEFNAPDETRLAITSRVGAVTNANLITVDNIRDTIIESMDSNGRPNWPNVATILREAVKRAYQGKSINIRFR